ncbi:hypothetical protein [uncultured Ruegeria sp.]|uniref:hypothetical protein n=1 Tax=uncultured Ruegeria sp. TaxID=259304 RepID=UPI002622BD4D|nr:hypothetical protein [uncultured Ruegeria sp.]
MLTQDRQNYYEFTLKHLENWFPDCIWIEEYFSECADSYILVDDVLIAFSDFLKICPDRMPNAGIPKLEFQPDIKTLDSLVRRLTKSSESFFYSLQWNGCSGPEKRNDCRAISFLGKDFVTPTSYAHPIETLEQASATMPFSCVITNAELSNSANQVANLVKGIIIEVLDFDGIFVSFRKNLV